MNEEGLLAVVRFTTNTRAQQIAEETLKDQAPALDLYPFERVHVLHNLASVYYFLGRYKDAESLLREAVTVLDHHGADDEQMMYVLVSMSSVLVRTRKPEEALDAVRRAQSIGQNIFGSDHVVLARALIAESAAWRSLNRPADARVAIERAITTIPDDLEPLLLAAWDEYSSVLRQAGRKREAKEAARHAAKIRDRFNIARKHTVDVEVLTHDRW